ncbi:MAG TPA: hypothetical protein VKP30_17965 [Polyangiaceae bacterium]|nr:hypothetical protein [Polyangiaceae bacterium]
MHPFEPFDAHRYEHRVAVRELARSPEQRFDRLAFALKAVRLLRIPNIHLAVFPSHRLTLNSGRELDAVPGTRWVMVGVPSDASARSIVTALTELMRAEDDSEGLQAAWAAAELMERAH